MTILAQQQLRELCDKATQGDWWIDSHGHRMMSNDNGDTIFVTFDKAMGPAVRNPETGNLSHWPNDWDASYIVAVQPKVVRGLLDDLDAANANHENAVAHLQSVCAERDRLNDLLIERETVRIGQSLQRHDDQKQIDELVALGIQQDKDEIERLRAENAELRFDAERYRWLRNSAPSRLAAGPVIAMAAADGSLLVRDDGHEMLLGREDADAAIDQAMTKEQP